MSEEKKELPISPRQMPSHSYQQQCEFIRNAFYKLSAMADSVEITFEPSDGDCDCDDSDGEWCVNARRGNKSFEATHEDIDHALWYVLEHLTAKDRTDYEARQRKRQEALSKLTADEKRILGVRDY